MNDSSTSVATVPFHGDQLFLVEHEGQPYTPIRSIVDSMGLDWSSQHAKIKANQRRWSTVVISAIVAADGKRREMTCMPLRKLAGWLMTISPNKIKNAEVREKVVTYQDECDDALWDYWTKGAAINPRMPLTPDHQRGIQKAVARRAQALPKGLQRLAYSRLYSHLKDRFGVAKYDQIPDEQYTQALAAVETCELEGEWMPAPEQVAEQGLSLTDTQAQNMLAALSHLLDINRIYEQYSLYEHLTGLGSPAGIKLHDHIKDGRLIARHLISKLENELLLVRARLGLPYRSLLH